MKKNGFVPILIILLIAILGVVGYLGYKNFWPKLQTAKWKTYTNDKYQFSLKYPEDYSYYESPNKDSAYFTPTQYKTSDVTALPMITFAMLQFPNSINNLQDELNQIKADDPNGIQNVKNITVDGTMAIQFNELQGNELDTQILLKTKISGNNIFMIKLTEYDKADKEMLSVYNQILSTFKFTDYNQTKINCTNPRPQVCSMLCIQPPPYICGSDGKSYCSTCQACGNPNIAWYQMSTTPCGGIINPSKP